MKRNFSISLKNRLALSYAVFISLVLGVLILLVNLFTGMFFENLIRDNITTRRNEIVSIIGEQYQSGRRRFDTESLEAVGRYFAGQGFIVTLEDEAGNLVWDARSHSGHHPPPPVRAPMNMRRSMGRQAVRPGVPIQSTHSERFPVNVGGSMVGTVSIETLSPVFYSTPEAIFLSSLNRILFIIWIVLTLLTITISIFLSRTIAKPILQAGSAARRIAQVYSKNTLQFGDSPGIRIEERYRTREIAELSESINNLAEELEEGERRQRQLTSDIAHELRTPLASLQGTLEAMIDGVYPSDPQRLESCHEEILRLTRLVEDLNLLSGLEWKNISLNKTEFDLSKLLYHVAEQWKSAVMEKGLELNLQLREMPVSADYDRLKQVFINILSNAVKFTEQGSITIKTESSGTLGEGENPRQPEWFISITDTGIGIPADDLPHIFERFYRSDKSRSRSTGGAGIGLSIAAAIVAAHGGTITAGSNTTEGSLAEGTTFLISLPK